ncbi:MAG: transcriptional repressor LexA [Gammaproteobacteria bacterium]|nr:transcriptional repressor LexA [Gammaproteobacteria bacterium]MDH5661119.1 transcriptional repressor LexA [Gammaproteobacteria bacterium]
MSNVNYLISNDIYKNKREVWSPELENLDISPEELCELPLLGYVTAGEPVLLSEEQETVNVPNSMVRTNSYALRVRGHSMVDDNIQDGDIIVVEKRETACNGESVVAMINGETVTLKKFFVEREGIRLQPANPTMEPIYLRNEEVQILGIVTGVIRSS